ncbi:hypothetical protein SE15_10345 [Thermanaerothrix daxensis]|uniref:Uncharacterized protein n=1 Tax=Thermanaerothrix daxensis TaxID=869279 RepID=A0A0P6YJF1_9CHLR|nr:hypothetical protein SE15_10345 [Thermanaerothrix daxensis]
MKAQISEYLLPAICRNVTQNISAILFVDAPVVQFGKVFISFLSLRSERNGQDEEATGFE